MFNRFNDLDYRFSWHWILCGYAIAFIYYLFKFNKGHLKFLSDGFGRNIWLNRSSFVDILFFISIMSLMGSWMGYYFTYQWFLDLILKSFRGIFQGPSIYSEIHKSVQIAVALAFLIYRDFASYWWHRLYHEIPFLFNFHACHHSVKTMNGFSVFRTHPLDLLGRTVIEGFILSTFFAVKNMLLGASFVVFTKGDFFLFMTIYMSTNVLRHTMLWVPFPRLVSYILISPAMHFIHHSLDPKHMYRNYGTLFSIWDWMFGSLYIPEDKDFEGIKIGLHDEDKLNENSFVLLLTEPVVRAVKRVKNIFN